MKRRGAVFPDFRLEVAAGCRAEEVAERLRREKVVVGGLDYAVEQREQGGAISLRPLSGGLTVNSFAPTATVQARQTPGGCAAEIRVGLNEAVRIVLIVFWAQLLLFAVLMLAVMLFGHAALPGWLPVLLPVLMGAATLLFRAVYLRGVRSVIDQILEALGLRMRVRRLSGRRGRAVRGCAVAAAALVLLTGQAHAETERWEVTDVAPLETEVIGNGARCMDVREDGGFLLGFPAGLIGDGRDHVNLYGADGTFEGGFSFRGGGDFCAGFDGEDVLIYAVRDQTLNRISRDGTVLERTRGAGDCALARALEQRDMTVAAGGAVYRYREWYVIPFPGMQQRIEVTRTEQGVEQVLLSRAVLGIWESGAAVWAVRALFFGGIAWIAWQVCAHYVRAREKRNENALPR